MARGQFLSILGLYNYDDSIFNDMSLPDTIDRDILVKNILFECAELELLYPDWDAMKLAIDTWSAKRLHAWDRLSRVLYEDYNPFINIKRDEDRTITQTRDLANTSNLKNNVNAFDATSADGVLRDTAIGSGTDTGTITTHEKYHLEGDSAITDAQDVLRKEVEVRTDFNLYDYIIKDFKNRFCLLVY